MMRGKKKERINKKIKKKDKLKKSFPLVNIV